MQVLDLELHVLAELLVERAERLVHQHELWVEDERAGERDALLLAARELGRTTPGKGAHLHHVEGALHLGVDLCARRLSHLQRKGEVLAHAHMREKRVVLEDHADSALVRRDGVDGAAAEPDLAVGGGLETR